MSFELFVALRFLREGRMQSVLILVGVSFGVAVMVFLTALITGLQDSLVRQTLSVQAHVVVRPAEEEARVLAPGEQFVLRREKRNQRTRSLDQWQVVERSVAEISGVEAVAATVAGSAFASRGNVSRSVALRGVEPDAYARIIPIDQRMRAGAFRLVGPEAVIGSELADDLGVSAGDKLRLVSTEERSDVFTISGVFDLGNRDVNQRWVFVSMRAAQTLLDLHGRASTIEVRVADVFEAQRVADAAAARTGLIADSWMQINKQLLIALRSQSSSSAMIQFLVVLAVALGIASVLVVSVVQKAREIGILRATGTSRRSILTIFLQQGALVGLAGSGLGSALGAAMALGFAQLATNPDGSPTFPVNLEPALFARAFAMATLVGIAAAVAPARRAAGLDPAAVIRNG